MTSIDDRYCEHHFKHCPMANTPAGTAHRCLLCPNHRLDVDYACFRWCDMESDNVCGECQHWQHDCSATDNGECFFYGNVKGTQLVDCPRYRPREEGSLNWSAWVERFVKKAVDSEVYESDCDSADVRAVRREARELYRVIFDS